MCILSFIDEKSEFQDNNEAKIKGSFSKLVERVAKNLSEKDISMDSFHLFLVDQFSNENIPMPDKIEDMFKAISASRLWGFDNYKTLKAIVDHFGENDPELENEIDIFEEALSHYRAAIKIGEYIDRCRNEEIADPKEPLPEDYFVNYPHKLTLKLNKVVTDQTLKYIDGLWREVAKFFVLPPLSAILRHIADGSILITWRISTESEKIIRREIKTAYKFLRERHITLVEIDEDCVYDEEKINEVSVHTNIHSTQYFTLCYMNHRNL